MPGTIRSSSLYSGGDLRRRYGEGEEEASSSAVQEVFPSKVAGGHENCLLKRLLIKPAGEAIKKWRRRKFLRL